MPTLDTHRLALPLLLVAALALTACPAANTRNGNTTGGDTTGGDTGGAVDHGPTVRRELHEERDSGAYEAVKVETRNGSIDIGVGPEGSAITVDGVLTGPRSLQLIAEPDPNTPKVLHIRVEFPFSPPLGIGATLSVRIPPNLKVMCEAGGSSVTVRGVQGDVEVLTNKGPVTVSDIGGSVDLTTQEATIECYRVSGNIKASTTRGEIVVQHFKGKLKLHTENSNIRIRTEKAPYLPETVEIEAETTGGLIKSELPGTLQYKLSLSAPEGGEVDAEDLDEDMDTKSMITTRSSVNCIVNGEGDGQIELLSTNGRSEFNIIEVTKPANKPKEGE
jgi:hypothetical protein